MKSSVKTTELFFNRGCLLWVIKHRCGGTVLLKRFHHRGELKRFHHTGPSTPCQ